MLDRPTPFHAGELEAQKRAGAGDVASFASGFIRPYLPRQHRAFHTSLPFLVVSGGDRDGRTWVTILDGSDGFVGSPNAKTLTLDAELSETDPLYETLKSGTEIGVLGIELSNRRRNRLSGRFHPADKGYAIAVRQAFGNCPQYIHERQWRRVAKVGSPAAHISDALAANQIAAIEHADTLFIGTGYQPGDGQIASGYDASHRGGEPGFVKVVDGTHLRIPDYAGNNFFNTIGNLMKDSRIGLLFVDFETGGMLHVSGRATIDWEARDSHDPAARRMVDVRIERVVDRPAALSLRWDKDADPVRPLAVIGKVRETEEITSFYLVPADGRPVCPFAAGQHLPVELDIPGQAGKVRRSYSLSGSPSLQGYRLSIKRERRGLASRFMHDEIAVGDIVAARKPSGEFVIPGDDSPLVLVSAGVGLTPMVSMIHEVTRKTPSRPVWYVHGARNGANQALRTEVDAVISAAQNAISHLVYSNPAEDDQIGKDYDAAGRVTAQTLLDLNAGPDANYMLCGPAQFIADIQSGLEQSGVPTDRIHFETFGPTG